MAKIEQIKAELNRRIELYGNPLGVADVRLQDERKGMLKALSDMLAFIDSLPAETASPELDLEKEIRNYDNYLDESGLTVTLDAIARHFAEWQKQQIEKEAVEGYIEGNWREQEDAPYELYATSDELDSTKYKIGDRVKLIILKDDGV